MQWQRLIVSPTNWKDFSKDFPMVEGGQFPGWTGSQLVVSDYDCSVGDWLNNVSTLIGGQVYINVKYEPSLRATIYEAWGPK